jgi:hypothetical protein
MQTKPVLRAIAQPPLSYTVGIDVALNERVVSLKITNRTPPAGVETGLSLRWGVQPDVCWANTGCESKR